MKLKKQTVEAIAKNNRVDIPSLGKDLRAIGCSLTTRDDDFEILGEASEAEINAVLAAHEGKPLPVEKTARLVIREGKAIAVTDDGEEAEVSLKADFAVREIQ